MAARGFRPFSRLNSAISGTGLLVAAFVGCGGEDQGRPAPPAATAGTAGTAGTGAVDCDVTAPYELITVIDFEGPPANGAAVPGKPPLQGTALSCNRELLTGPGGEGGAGGEGGGAGAGGAPNASNAPVCGFNFNHDQTVIPGTGDCDRDPVAMGEPTINLSTQSPWVGLEVPGGRCGEPTHAYHLEATNMGVCFSMTTGRRGWGSNFLIEFTGSTNPEGVEVDASAWDGVAFWARLGEGPSNSTINFVVGDAETSGADYETPSPSGWPACVTADHPSDAVKCDPFGVVVTLTKDWAFYAIPFADLKQKGYGQPAPRGAIDPSRIWRFQITTSTGDWDFFVDDISFYRNRP